MSANSHAGQTARRLLTTRMALAIGFGMLLTLLVLSGIDAVHVISQLQTSNESILEEFLGRQMKLDGLRSAIYLSCISANSANVFFADSICPHASTRARFQRH
jgi:hypothetical protein